MKAARSRIAAVVADQLLNGADSATVSKQIAAYLLSERRIGEIDSLVRDVQALWAKAGHVEVLAASAHPLSGSATADITARVKTLFPNAKQIVVTEVHDASVVGGVRLSLADQQLDLTVRAKLNKFKQLTTAGKDS